MHLAFWHLCILAQIKNNFDLKIFFWSLFFPSIFLMYSNEYSIGGGTKTGISRPEAVEAEAH